ncbi:hypothetical protein GQ53DRAFT_824441 [Thozetella sp. PMI_491]|nr:hypothetical protein GQ53DRAFT_824441 [Thozetella sp. PMI_491]
MVTYLELNKVFVELLREFNIQIIDPQEPWEKFSYGIILISNFWTRVTSKKLVPYRLRAWTTSHW